jgi:predicted kinase
MTKTLILFRGLPGSGKSTLAETLCDKVFSADMFFEQDGRYNFDGSKLPDAHKWCRESVDAEMTLGIAKIIGVANTFTTEWEMKAYFDLAEDHGWRISTVIVENRHGSVNVHDVPDEAIERMKSRFVVQL